MNKQLLFLLLLSLITCITMIVVYNRIEFLDLQKDKYNNPNILPQKTFCQDADGNLRYKDQIIGNTDGISLYYGKKDYKDIGFYVTKNGKVYYSPNLNYKFDKEANYIGSTRLSDNSNQGASIFPPICTIGDTIDNFDIYVNDKSVSYTGHMLYYVFGIGLIQNKNGTLFCCQNLGTYGKEQKQVKWVAIGNINDNNGGSMVVKSDNIVIMQYKNAQPISYSLKNSCPIYPTCETRNKVNEIICNGKKQIGDLFYQVNDNSGCIVNSDNKPLICSNNLYSTNWEVENLVNPICHVDKYSALRCTSNSGTISYSENIPRTDNSEFIFLLRTDYNAGLLIMREGSEYVVYATPALHAMKVIWKKVDGMDSLLLPKMPSDFTINGLKAGGYMISNWVTIQKKDYIPLTCMFPIE